MTHTPAAQTPLTDKALARLRAMGEGNGLDAKKIELIGTDEKEFTLRAEMLLSVDVVSARVKIPGTTSPTKNAQIVPSVNEIATRVTKLKETLLETGDWIKETTDQLKSEPGQGFGIERAEITLENLAKVFQATQNCAACHGAGSTICEICKGKERTLCKVCNATGQETCYQCHGTGKNSNALGTPCAPCHGRGSIQHVTMQNCPQCHGRGNLQRDVQQSCPACHGAGRDAQDHNKPCHSCHGRGTVHAVAMQACEICHGRGQVQQAQTLPCQTCHGRGTLPPTPQQQICQICNGQMRILCRTCQGKKEIACLPCHGKGKIVCATCHGEGKFTVEERALPTARCQFRIFDAADVPSGLRRALDRYGFKLLIRAGAAISCGSAGKAENKTATIAYSATFPFAELRLRINGKAMLAAVVGEKASIRDIANFLDPVFDQALKKLEQNPAQSNGLNKAFTLRAMRELFDALQLGGEGMAAFRKLYPIGLSLTMIERMQALLEKLVKAGTFAIRAGVAAVSLMLLCGVYYAVLNSGLRLHLAKATHIAAAYALDAGICAGSFFFILFAMRVAAAMQIRSLSPKNTGLHIKAQRAGSLGIAAGTCAVILYAGLIWFLKATPGFLG